MYITKNQHTQACDPINKYIYFCVYEFVYVQILRARKTQPILIAIITRLKYYR